LHIKRKGKWGNVPAGEWLWIAGATRFISGSYGLFATSEDRNATGAVEVLAVRGVENMPDDITMVYGERDFVVLMEFPWRDGIGQGPQTDFLSLGALFKFFPGLAFGPGAGVVAHPGEAYHDQFFIEALAAFQIDQCHGLSELVPGVALAIEGDGFHFHHFSTHQLGGKFLSLVPKNLTLVGRLDAVKPDPLFFPIMQHGERVTVHDGHHFILPGFGRAAAKEAGEKDKQNVTPFGFSHTN
jgi:hypothetical protein